MQARPIVVHKTSSKFKYSLLEIVSLVVFIMSVYSWKYIPAAFGYSVFYIPFVSFIIFVFAFDKGIISSFFHKKVFAFVTSISMELYLTHQLIFRYCGIFLQPYLKLPVPIFIILSIMLCFLISYVIHVLRSTNIPKKKGSV